MPQQIYSGQLKFRLETEQAKQVKQAKRTRDSQVWMAKKQEKQRQRQKNIDQVNAELMSQRAIERYEIDNCFYI